VLRFTSGMLGSRDKVYECVDLVAWELCKDYSISIGE
jgi:hypothetical protein